MMNSTFAPARGRHQMLLTACLAIGFSDLVVTSQAQTTLEAKLTPTVVVTGPLGSLQQVQYSTDPEDTNSWTTLSHVRITNPPSVPFFDTNAQGERRFYRTKLVGVADTNLVWIPPGTFLMGSPTNEQGRGTNEGPQTQVTFTRGFFMGRYEVKNGEFLAYAEPDLFDAQVRTNHPQHAVRLVSWFDALDYCHARTTNEQAQGMIPPGWVYRLPTEAEWEYAARAGTTNPFAFGNELRNDGLRSDATFDGRFPYPTNIMAGAPTNYASNAMPPGGLLSPNAFGLYDMHGGVNEWVGSALADNYNALPGGSITNPPAVIVLPMYRGGGAYDTGTRCRSAGRYPAPDATANAARVGLRVVLIPSDP